MDAFFAAVEERDKPRLKGRPIVVGADPGEGRGRGVVSTANYAARKYGIRSAMPISRAWELAQAGMKAGGPEVVWIRPDIGRYTEASRKIMEIIRARVPVIEQTSVDEAYLDLSFAGSFDPAIKLVRELKEKIKKEEKLTASVGLGPNKLIAKIASDREKPDGLTAVRPEEAEKFLEPLPVRTLPGVGPKTEQVLLQKGVRTIGDLKKLTEGELKDMFGKIGGYLHEKARARDDSPLETGAEAKSIGEQQTYLTDVRDPAVLTKTLEELAGSVWNSFRKEDFRRFGRVVVTVRFAGFLTRTRSRTLPEPADSEAVLKFEALKLFLPFLDARENPGRKAIRLLGVRVEKLE